MSKKITSFLTMLVALFMSVSASAQLDELQLKTITPGTVVDQMEPNTWYLLHQGRDGNTGVGTYAPVLAGEMPSYGGYMADQGIGQDLLKKSIDEVGEASSATAKAAYLVRFVPTDNEGGYNIQFGTGNWLSAPAGSGNSQKFTSTDNVYDAGEFNFYAIDPEGAPGAFGFNVYNMGQQIDNNGTGYTIVTWGSGMHESVLDENGMIVSNSIWSIVEVTWGEANALEEAANELKEAYDQYFNYSGTFETGTEPGQYGEAEVAAFEAALEAAYEASDAALAPDYTGDLTPDALRAMKQALIDAYNAVIASQVKYTIPSGYYFIKNGFMENGQSKWYETVTNEETLEEETIYVDKYMVSNLSGTTITGGWRSVDFEDVTSTAPALWKVTAQEDGTYDIQNTATDGRFNNVAQSTGVTMDPESENMMAIDYVGKYDDIVYVDIRVSTQAANGYLYLHANNHGGGSGKGSNLVGWACGKGDNSFSATEWTFVAVSEEEAQKIIEEYAPFRDHDKMIEDYKIMVADAKAKIEIAKDIQVSLDEETPLITDVAQFSSPYTEPSEGSIEALIDGNASTFWHSNWSNGTVAGGTHYLQVEMPDMEVSNAAFTYTRRAVANDHLTEVGIFGTNDPDAEKDGCEELGVTSLPFTNNTETLTSEVFPTKGYKYLRFYGNKMHPNTRGYFHMAEFQLYPAEVIQSETCQYNVMGDIVKNLESLIEEQKDIEPADLGIDEYNAMKTAYEAFIAKFVDPAELRQTLADKADVVNSVKIGTQPGFWTGESTAGAYKALYDEATSYDKAGDYTPEKSQQYIDRLNNEAADLFASAIAIRTDKWYRIRFASEEEFETYGWDKVAGNGVTNNENVQTVPPLFGKYISVANYFEEDGVQYIEPIGAEEIGLGHQIYFLDLDDIQDEDAAMFRFVAVGDSAYMIQSKATGMFLKAAGTSGAVTFSVHPSLFNVRAIGYGLNVMAAKSFTGEAQSYLHAQVSHNVLVTWDVDYPGSRSGMFIEEAEDVAADFDGTEFNVPMAEGSIRTFCFPMEVSVAEGQNATMWGVSSIEGTTVKLAKVEGPAIGGRPFILVYGNTENYDAENADLQDMVVLKHGYEISATEPMEAKGLKGTYSGETVGAGVIVADGNALVISKRSNTTVGANSAYIAGDEKFDLEATLEVIWDETAPDGIETALQNVSKSGAVYTIDGRLVSRKANLNDLSGFGKGIYILNGVKVVVK